MIIAATFTLAFAMSFAVISIGSGKTLSSITAALVIMSYIMWVIIGSGYNDLKKKEHKESVQICHLKGGHIYQGGCVKGTVIPVK